MGRGDGAGKGGDEPLNGARQKQALLPLSCSPLGPFPVDILLRYLTRTLSRVLEAVTRSERRELSGAESGKGIGVRPGLESWFCCLLFV